LNEFDLSSILNDLLKFREERDWEKFHKPKEVVSALNIEAGELLEHFLWRGNEDAEEIISDKNRFECIKEEVADVTIYLLFLCNDLGIDLEMAIKEKLQKNMAKYPSELFKARFLLED
jgi:NTP pyrophosphatase (non-canonical NTP hydrolase)